MSLFKKCTLFLKVLPDLPNSFGSHFQSSNCFTRHNFLPPNKWKGSRGFRDNKKNGEFAKTPAAPDPSQIPSNYKVLIKPLIFTAGFSASALVGCSIWQYESYRHKSNVRKQQWDATSWITGTWLPDHKKRGELRQQINDLWNDLSEGQKLFAPVLFANVLVYLAWKVPKFQPTMLLYFATNPAAKIVCWPMFLSTFSHYGIIHLAANMFVLHSFSSLAVASMGKEQTAALYLSAGVIASYFSFFHKIITRTPAYSVGASGAIMAILGLVCTIHPDTKLSLIFLPTVTFTAGSAIKFIVGFDLLGIIFRWKFFDHAAHVGGALTGICWGLWGNSHIWKKRDNLLRSWHEFRTKPV